MIDKYWREFLNGSNIMFVRALIQDTLESFFKFMRENNFYDEDPYRVQAFEKAINTKDLQLIQNIYSQDFSFYYQVPSSKKIESIDARIINLKINLKRLLVLRITITVFRLVNPLLLSLKHILSSLFQLEILDFIEIKNHMINL